MRQMLFAAMVGLFTCTVAPAADPVKPAAKPTKPTAAPPSWSKVGPASLAAYFRAETTALRDRCLADVKSLDDWEARRGELRRQLFEMLSLDPLPEKTDLKATITGRAEAEDVVVENVHFQSRPNLYVTGNLYLPKNIEKAAPAILYVCGHGGVKKDGISYGNKVFYQRHGAWFAQHGYVCLVIDSLQLGEIEATHHGTYRFGRWWWNSRGYSPAGVEAWNCIRALDYLQSRKEVDPEKLGVSGRSGGGAYSWWIAALDERIKAAVPVAGITDLENHVIDGTVEGHCDCMFFVNTYRWDYPQVAALVAPRPLLISNTDKDNIFPLEGVVRTHERARRIYNLYGEGSKLGLQITEGGHDDTQELQIHAMVWFDRFLRGERQVIVKPAVELFKQQQLRVFDKLPADEINTKIDESFVAAAPPPSVPKSADEWVKTREATLKALREKTFRAWPSAPPRPLVKLVYNGQAEGVTLNVFEFTSEEHLPLRLYQLEPGKDIASPRAVSAVVTDETGWKKLAGAIWPVFKGAIDVDSPPTAQPDLWKQIREFVVDHRRRAVWFAPRGIGASAAVGDEKKQVQIRRRYMLLGQTLAGQQAWDVRRMLQVLAEPSVANAESITLHGYGEMAVATLYASLFEPKIAHVRLVDPPASHANGPDLLNVLRFADLPLITAIAAERSPLTIQSRRPEDWAFPREVARRLEWGDKRIVVEEVKDESPVKE